MITIEIMGGLGNQLFQIFTLISCAKNHDIPFYFEKKTISYGSRKIDYWNNLLSELTIYLKHPSNFLSIFHEKQFNYNEIQDIDPTFNNKLLGYFQSYKYFENNYHEILNMIKFNEKIIPYSNLYDYSNTISLHFRIGDYKDLQNFHPILKIQYYFNAIEEIINKKNKNNWNILYFYEDDDFIQVISNINMILYKFPSLNFIRIEKSLQDWEQLLVMSQCLHNIIANSTFSWWGAYLNKNNDKIVTYPSTWFGPALCNKNVSDLFPDTWNKINE